MRRDSGLSELIWLIIIVLGAGTFISITKEYLERRRKLKRSRETDH
jgi:hypothetical protein